MTTPIDWTKPVELMDGTPVRVLATDLPEPYPVLVFCQNDLEIGSVWRITPDGKSSREAIRAFIRNKPQTITREWWVNEWVGGLCFLHPTKEHADQATTGGKSLRIACHKITYTFTVGEGL
jgi:hypothetical protein